MTTTANEGAAIYSTMGDDPDFGELVEMFVEEMPDRIAAYEEAFAQGDLETLRRLAHQMKGAAGSYGFDAISPLAAVTEHAITNAGSDQAIRDALAELIVACRAVRSGSPG